MLIREPRAGTVSGLSFGFLMLNRNPMKSVWMASDYQVERAPSMCPPRRPRNPAALTDVESGPNATNSPPFPFSLSYIVRFPFIPLFFVRSLFTSSIGSFRFPFFPSLWRIHRRGDSEGFVTESSSTWSNFRLTQRLGSGQGAIRNVITIVGKREMAREIEVEW